MLTKAIAIAEALLRNDPIAHRRATLTADLAAQEKVIVNLVRAIEAGGDLSPLVQALKTAEARKRELQAELGKPFRAVASVEMRRRLRGYLDDWLTLLRGNVSQGQSVLRRLIVGRLEMDPAGVYYKFRGKGTLAPVIDGVLSRQLASPTGCGNILREVKRRVAA